MVALKKYDRIEAVGLWRPDADTQRREVVVVLGDATLTIKTLADEPLAHWSIAALKRANPGQTPARFHPDGDLGEALDLEAQEAEMIEALDMLRRAVERARPRPGRLRWLGLGATSLALLYAALFWLPGALVDHTVRVVPEAARAQIGQALLARMQPVTGAACGTSANSSSLARLGARLNAPQLAVMRGGLSGTLHLPGGLILLSRQLVEDYEAPDVAAGFILAEQVRAAASDPLRSVLEEAGLYASFRLLTTGRIEPAALDRYAEAALSRPPEPAPIADLLARFERARVPSTPYAYALDVTGERVLPLIEGDPFQGAVLDLVIRDADWLRLQAICES